MEKTDEQLKKEMIKKVDKARCKKLLAMCFNVKDSEIIGFNQMLEMWANNKLGLYKLFGENLKLEKEICITRDEIQEMSKKTGESTSWMSADGEEKFSELVNNLQNINPCFYRIFDSYFRFSAVKETVPYVDDYCFGDSIIKRHLLKNNSKILFSQAMHDLFMNDKVDIEVSKYIQECASDITGKMYVSIDPFDYITMSMNKSRWTSCHSLHSEITANYVNVGCYSAGIFSYMCDKVSAIAYKTNGQKYKFEWNRRGIFAESKNWRQMVFIHPDLQYFICSRQYPYKTEILTKIIREMIENVIDSNKEIEEDSEINNDENKWRISRRCHDNKSFIENEGFVGWDCDRVDEMEDLDESLEEYEVLHYNDMLNGYNYQFAYQSKNRKSSLKHIVIGSYPVCPICGETTLYRHARPACDNCISKYSLGF